jgi:hypothetical protein
MGLLPGVIFTLRNRNTGVNTSTSTTACTPTTSSTSATMAEVITTTPKSSACSTWLAAAARAKTSPSASL